MRKRKQQSLRRINLKFVINLIKRYFTFIIMGLVALIAVLVVLSEIGSRRDESPSAPETVAENNAFLPTEIVQVRQPPQRPVMPPKKEQPSPQLSRPAQETHRDSVSQNEGIQKQESHESEIARLQKERQSLEKQIAQMQSEDRERKAWHNEQLQMLENHTRQIEDLGKTLQRILKTPREIRIIATNLKNQAGTLQSQARSGDQKAGSSSITQKIQAERQSTLREMASDLNDIALKLQRSQGDPSKVRVIALEIQRKSESLRGTIESNRSKKIPINSQLLTLEKKYDSLSKKIQELQRQQVTEKL